MNIVICNNCSNQIDITDIKESSVDDIDVQYFKCSNCNKKYITICKDKKLRSMMQQYKCMEQYDNVRKKGYMQDKLIKYLDEMKEYSDSLKARVEDKI